MSATSIGRTSTGELSSEGPLGAHWRVSATKNVSYEVCIHHDVLDPANPALEVAGVEIGGGTPRRLVVVDKVVNDLYGDRIARYFTERGLEHRILVLDAREQVKTIETVLEVASEMGQFGVARRAEPVVAIGGGVLTDVVGLASSLYRRSTPFVRVPTTLLGMVDAAIGAKTGVNLGNDKNRLGSYHPAASTLIDRSFLATLDERHLSNGLAEILKIGLAMDPVLVDLLEQHGSRLVDERMQKDHHSIDRRVPDEPVRDEVFRRAITGMLSELAPNLWEETLTRLVDYGHSFSPTIEMTALPDLLHGEAVSVDMALTTIMAERRGWITASQRSRIIRVMRALRLPSWHPVCTAPMLSAALRETTRHRDLKQRLPLPVGIGAVRFVDDVTDSEISRAVNDLRRLGHHPEQSRPGRNPGAEVSQ